MPKYDSDTIPVCVNCDSNSTSQIKSCIRCKVDFCKHFASHIDLRFCANCIGDVKITETIIEKTVEHEKADGTVSFSRKYQAKMIKLTGVDWLFASHLIEDMTDSEIDATVEYHRANVDLMLMERDSRKQERMRKLAGIKIVHGKHESQEEREKRLAKATGKKSKTKVKELDGPALLAMLTALTKSGLTKDQIMDALGKGVK